MTTWAITGIAGFIGSNLAEALLERGDVVVGLDNLSTGKQVNIDRLVAKGGNRLRFMEGDIRDSKALDDLLHGTDVAVHLAAQVSVQKSVDDPVDTDATNVGGFVSVADGAARAGLRKLIYASSCAVYGDNPKLPLDEGEAPRPMSPYAVSKYANDLYADVFSGLNENLDLVGLRFFNIFGPWQDVTGGYAAVIPRWIDLMLNGGQAKLFGDGSATRDFCHVNNVVAAIIGLGEQTGRPPHCVYNIGTGVQTSLNELHRTLIEAIEATGRQVTRHDPEYLPWMTGDIVHSGADISRATSEIGYAPGLSLAAGVRQLLAVEYGLNSSGEERE